MSRLQALQAAIATQVEALAKAKPTQRVGLVTFASDVTIYSDGTGEPRVLAGSRLTDYAALQAAGDGATPAKPVKDTAEALVRRVYGLREEGATALGPAVLVAVAMAAGRPGSRVVIVTDGMANTGLGSLEPPELPRGASPEMKEQALQSAKADSDAFYAKVRGLAIDAGVTVDVIGFSDANCNLEALSALAEATGGAVTRVEPATITEQFAGVLEEEVLAVNASVTMVRPVLTTDAATVGCLAYRRQWASACAAAAHCADFYACASIPALRHCIVDLHIPRSTPHSVSLLNRSLCTHCPSAGSVPLPALSLRSADRARGPVRARSRPGAGHRGRVRAAGGRHGSGQEGQIQARRCC